MNESGIESPQPTQLELPPAEKIVKCFYQEQPHLLLTQVILYDGTDGYQELVHEKEWLLHPSEKNLRLSGNLFVIEDMITKGGSILLRIAPLPHARHRKLSADLYVYPRQGGGYDFYLIDTKGETMGEWIILDYENGIRGRTEVFHNWQRLQRPPTPSHRIPRFLSNTWGDRSQDSRLTEEFIFQELTAAAELGVEILQLDDGWQRGITSNSILANKTTGVWEGFWDCDPRFWEPHPQRLPRGLEPIVLEANRLNIKIGLWFAPDSWNGQSNWQKDAKRILELHDQFGIEHFKLDSIKTPTLLGQKNLAKFIDMVQRDSQGKVVFDLDITAGIRPGYFGTPQAGPLFIENRYTDWHNYWPHQTLRNLWSLARWIDPRRLRMEFLNNQRNKSLYNEDPLAPDNYQADTLFAMNMFANPLGWFEVSRLSKEYIQRAAPVIKLWKKHKEALFEGNIFPIGAKPDGWKPTGFLSLAPNEKSGYLLVFREFYEKTNFSIDLPLNLGKVDWEMIYETGESHISHKERDLQITINRKAGFLWARFSRRI